MKTAYDCVVVANGSFPQTARPLELLKDIPLIIACDGAVENLHNQKMMPTVIVGDLDSISPKMLELYADRIHMVEDQEVNDLTKAIQFAHSAGFQKILILGATGLREDHTLGNISLLTDYTTLFERIDMISDHGIFTPLSESGTLESFPGQQISIFSVYPEGTITTEGLKWPICNRRLTAWWQGTLNEATGNTFTITLSPGSKVIVYRNT